MKDPLLSTDLRVVWVIETQVPRRSQWVAYACYCQRSLAWNELKHLRTKMPQYKWRAIPYRSTR